MMISLDTGDHGEVRQVKEWGFPIDKITSNPTSISAAMARRGGEVYDIVMQLRDEVGRGVPISVEALGTRHYDISQIEVDNFVHEAAIINDWDKSLVVKIPAIRLGFEAAKEIDFIPINFTLVFSQHQGYLSADYGGAYSSPFVGRYDDKLMERGVGSRDGMDLVDEIVRNFRSFEFETKVLTASVRNLHHIERAAELGSHAITIPFSVFRMLRDQNRVEWLKSIRNAATYSPQKPRQPTFSGKFEDEKMRDYERELLHEGLVKFIDDARKSRYSII